MATTVLIVEHVLSGVQFAVVIALYCVCAFGWPETVPPIDSNWAIPITFLGLAIVYPLGVLVDEFADLISSPTERLIRQREFAAHRIPQQTHLVDTFLKQDSEFLQAYFGYLRMRIRISRSSALNMFLMTIATGWFCWSRSSLFAEPIRTKLCVTLCVFVLMFCVISLITWQSQVRTFAKRIAHIAQQLESKSSGQWPLLVKATRLAAELHSSHIRKGSDVPYLSHLFGVTSVVLEHGGDDATAAAAMLHDAAEDQGGEVVLGRIRDEVTGPVADLVRDCSDTLTKPKPAWRERKERAIASIATANDEVCLIKAADVLHNVQTCQRDFVRLGDVFWTRFTTGRDGILWYYHEMAKALRHRVPDDLAKQLDGSLESLSHAITGDGTREHQAPGQ